MPPTSSPHPTQARAGTRWQLRLLGGLELGNGRQTFTRLPSRAHVALLARLALAPQRAHAREELIELLWPGVALDTGRNRLRQVLSTLKSVLEPDTGEAVVLADRISLRVAPGALACDALLFEQSLRAGRAAEAAALYRGELLPGYYDEWIDDERQRLAALFDRLPPGAPLPPAALAVSAAAEPVDIGAGALPHYLTPLFGAAEQAARLEQAVQSRRLVTVLGPGGSGKTRLAVELARMLAGRGSAATGFDRLLFVPLVACASREQAIDALAAAVQAEAAAGAPLDAVLQALGGRRVLLLLDNFEQLVPLAQDVVAMLLARLPQLHVLCTSRRPLALDGEHEFGIAALPLPEPDATLAEAAANPALALFIDRARAVRAGFEPGERDHRALVALMHELEGMPLAIELAASRLRSFAPAALLQRLRGGGTPRLTLLARDGPRGGADPRHASMQRVVAWSWSQLGAPAQRLLVALTLLRGSFTGATVAELWPDDDPALLLDELLTHSLLQRVAPDDELPRFALYEPVREYAATQLDAADAARVQARLRAWALLWAAEQPPTPSLPAVRAEMPNLVGALASAVAAGDAASLVGLLAALRRCLEEVPLPHGGLTLAEQGVAACTDPALRARGQVLLAPLLHAAGRLEPALALAEAGLAACTGAAERADALGVLARILWRARRRADEVQPLLDEALALEAQAPDPALRARLLAMCGFIAIAQPGGRAAARALHGQALLLWQRGGNQHAVNSGRYNLAVLAQNHGEHALALELLAPVLASARELQDWRRLSQALNVQGNAYSGLHQWNAALASYRSCLRLAWQTMTRYDLAFGLWNLPRALARLRRPGPAVQLMAFAAQFWEQGFGELGDFDRRYIERVRRLVARQIGADDHAAHWQAGLALTLPQAYALSMAC